MSSEAPAIRPTIIDAQKERWSFPDFFELWRYHYLFRMFVVSDIKARYRQTLIGPAWHFIQPIGTTLLYTIVFGTILEIPSNGMPYPVFAMSGIMIWTLFSSFLGDGTRSLTGQGRIILKVYVPPLIMPLMPIGLRVIDTVTTLFLLFVLCLYFGVPISNWFFLAPFFWLLAALAAFSLSLWLSVFNVTYRDISLILGSVMSLLFYATPVFYPTSVIPENYAWLLYFNPLVAIVEGFRWSLLGTPPPDPIGVAICVLLILIVLIPGLRYFNYSAKSYVDRL